MTLSQHTYVPIQRSYRERDGFDAWAIQLVGAGLVQDDETQTPFVWYSLAAAQDAADEMFAVRQRASAASTVVIAGS